MKTRSLHKLHPSEVHYLFNVIRYPTGKKRESPISPSDILNKNCILMISHIFCLSKPMLSYLDWDLRTHCLSWKAGKFDLKAIISSHGQESAYIV